MSTLSEIPSTDLAPAGSDAEDTVRPLGYMLADKRISQLADVWAFTGWERGMR